MSWHIEWMEAAYVGVALADEGDEMPDGQIIETDYALTLMGDQGVVIQGTGREMRALLARITEALLPVMHESDPGLGARVVAATCM